MSGDKRMKGTRSFREDSLSKVEAFSVSEMRDFTKAVNLFFNAQKQSGFERTDLYEENDELQVHVDDSEDASLMEEVRQLSLRIDNIEETIKENSQASLIKLTEEIDRLRQEIDEIKVGKTLIVQPLASNECAFDSIKHLASKSKSSFNSIEELEDWLNG